MKTCKNCKWWFPTPQPQEDNNHRSCLHTKVGPSVLEQLPNNLFVNDCLGEWELTTGPDFGCIHFEEKPPIP